MKKLILVFATMAITVGAYAQTDSTNKKMSPPDMNPHNKSMQHNPVDKSHPDGVMMQNGKIMQVKDGKMTILNDDMTLSNGTKVMSDGTFILKDGTKTMMKEGQHLDLSGNVTTLKTEKDKNMYLVPDSTRNRKY